MSPAELNARTSITRKRFDLEDNFDTVIGKKFAELEERNRLRFKWEGSEYSNLDLFKAKAHVFHHEVRPAYGGEFLRCQ